VLFKKHVFFIISVTKYIQSKECHQQKYLNEKTVKKVQIYNLERNLKQFDE